MTRNRVDDETAERNRTTGRNGGYTFHAPIEPPEAGELGFTFACVRLGEHAHIDVGSGYIVRNGPYDPFPRVSRGDAGHLILRWEQWLLLRDILDIDPHVHIVEVERPTPGQLAVHAPDAAARRALTFREALDRIPHDVDVKGIEVIDRLAPTMRMTATAAVGHVLAELYREGLIDFPGAAP